MRIDVGEPEHDRGHRDKQRHMPKTFWKSLQSGHDHREHDDRPVHKAAETLAQLRAAEANQVRAGQIARHLGILASFDARGLFAPPR
jgi:hypothetical protein